jgi:hypothetical protein
MLKLKKPAYHLLAYDVSRMLQSASVEGATPTESPDERKAPGNPLLLTEAWCSVVYALQPDRGAGPCSVRTPPLSGQPRPQREHPRLTEDFPAATSAGTGGVRCQYRRLRGTGRWPGQACGRS